MEDDVLTFACEDAGLGISGQICGFHEVGADIVSAHAPKSERRKQDVLLMFCLHPGFMMHFVTSNAHSDANVDLELLNECKLNITSQFFDYVEDVQRVGVLLAQM